ELELDGLRPDLIGTFHMKENSAVTGQVFSWRIGLVTPFEFSSQMVVFVFSLGYEIAVLLAGNVNHPVTHLEDLVGIIIEPLGLQKDVKTFEIFAVEQPDRRTGR